MNAFSQYLLYGASDIERAAIFTIASVGLFAISRFFHRKYQNTHNELYDIGKASCYFGILIIIGISLYIPQARQADEAKTVKEHITSYIKTLDEKTSDDIILIKDMKAHDKTGITMATVTFTANHKVISKKMIVVPELDDKKETYVSYKELDKTPQQIMSDRKTSGTYPAYKIGATFNLKLHLSKNHPKIQ